MFQVPPAELSCTQSPRVHSRRSHEKRRPEPPAAAAAGGGLVPAAVADAVEVLRRGLAGLCARRLRLRADHARAHRDQAHLRPERGAGGQPGLGRVRLPLGRRPGDRRDRRPVRPPRRHGAVHRPVLPRHTGLRARPLLRRALRGPAGRRSGHGRRVRRELDLRDRVLAAADAQQGERLPDLRLLDRDGGGRLGLPGRGARLGLARPVPDRPAADRPGAVAAPQPAREPGLDRGHPAGRRRSAAAVGAGHPLPGPPGAAEPGPRRGGAHRARAGLHPLGVGRLAVHPARPPRGRGLRGLHGPVLRSPLAHRRDADADRLRGLPLLLAAPGAAADVPQDGARLHPGPGRRRPLLRGLRGGRRLLGRGLHR